MAVPLREEYKADLEKQNLEVRNMVREGLEQVSRGKTKDLDEVCSRLESKYLHAGVQNQDH